MYYDGFMFQTVAMALSVAIACLVGCYVVSLDTGDSK